MFIRSLQNLKTDGCAIETFDYEDTLLEWEISFISEIIKTSAYKDTGTDNLPLYMIMTPIYFKKKFYQCHQLYVENWKSY